LSHLRRAAAAADKEAFEGLMHEATEAASSLAETAIDRYVHVMREIAELKVQFSHQSRHTHDPDMGLETRMVPAEKDGPSMRQAGARPPASSPGPLPPRVKQLFDAIALGNLDHTRDVLVDLEVNARHGRWDETALFHAMIVPNRSVDMVQFLLSAGAQPGLGTAEGYTPLHAIAAYPWDGEPPDRTAALAKCLVDAGADIEARTRTYGWTPLHRAVMEGRAPEVDALLRVGADPNRAYSETSEPWFSPGRLPLQIAGTDSAKFSLLLKQGADPNLRDGHGETVLRYLERLMVEHITKGSPEDIHRHELEISLDVLRGWRYRS